MRCLIVDDEALARRLLADHVSKIPTLELVATCMNAIEAQKILQEQQVDLLFLDIQMPELTGIDFLKSLSAKPLTVFTTAYSEYALQAFELDVIDYLVKPISFERFFQTITKAQEFIQTKTPTPSDKLAEKAADYFFVKADAKIVKLNYEDVLFIEGLREYVRIHTTSGQLVPLLSMNKLEEILPPTQFIRIHRSTIINMKHIDLVQGNMVVIGNHQLTVSKSQRERFMDRINQHGLF